MSSLPSSSARLRRTFHYPADDDDDNSSPEVLDEQEQEALIATLSAENASRNAQFRLILLSLPLLSTIPYLPLLFRTSSARLIALLSLTSLLSTAWLLYKLPPGATGIAPLDAWTRKESVAAATSEAKALLTRKGLRGAVGGAGGGGGPLEIWLPYLNLALGLVVMLLGLVGAGKGAWFGGIGVGNWPILVYVVVTISNVVMASVDPERELTKLKYNYKGA